MKRTFGMPGRHVGQVGDRPLRRQAGRLVRHRLGRKAELERDPLGMFLQGREKRLVDVRGIDVALGGAGLAAAVQARRPSRRRITSRKTMSVEMCVANESTSVAANSFTKCRIAS